MTTMLAAMLRPDKDTLSLEQVAKPEPADDDVLLRVRACGVCHSDLVLVEAHALYTSPFIAGHEICGEAVSVGKSVSDITIGALYSVDIFRTKLPGDGWRYALHGTVGLGRDGGYAEFVTIPAAALVKVPEGVTAAQAAVAADAGTTVYHAVFGLGKIQQGERVLIIGAGGLGIIAVQLVRLAGASQVLVVDPRESSRKLALEHGADQTFTPDEFNTALAQGTITDAVLDFVSVPATFKQGYAALVPGSVKGLCDARLISIGVGNGTVELDMRILSIAPIRILPSLYGTREDLINVLELIKEGKLKVELEEAPLSRVNDVLHDLHEGKIRSRMVIVP